MTAQSTEQRQQTRRRYWILITIALHVALWVGAQPAGAARPVDPPTEDLVQDVQHDPDTGVINVDIGLDGLPPSFFGDAAVSDLLEQNPDLATFCAGGCSIDVTNALGTFQVDLPAQIDFGGVPSSGPNLPWPPEVSVGSLACLGGSVVGFDAVAENVAYLELAVEYRAFGDPGGAWTRLQTSGGEDVLRRSRTRRRCDGGRD